MDEAASTPKLPARDGAPTNAPEDTPPGTDSAVLRLWVRPAPKIRPVAVDSIELLAGEGIVGDHSRGRMRHVTLVFQDDWDRAAEQIGHPAGAVDPIGRRANVLLSGGDATRLIGKTIALGPARLRIRGVTAPCPTMDKAAKGMMVALKPDARSGVWGRVLTGGIVRAGDLLVILGEAQE